LTARVAAASAGTAAIELSTPGGMVVSTTAFTVTDVPVLSGFQPTSGVPGTSIVVLGRNLIRASAVDFDGLPATITARGDAGTWLQAPVPMDAAPGPVTVTSGGGTASTGDLTPPKLFVVSPVTPCGNGVLDDGETCDDGNLVPGDCCDSTCHVEPAGSACPD